jgi:hypothetical protein
MVVANCNRGWRVHRVVKVHNADAPLCSGRRVTQVSAHREKSPHLEVLTLVRVAVLKTVKVRDGLWGFESLRFRKRMAHR